MKFRWWDRNDYALSTASLPCWRAIAHQRPELEYERRRKERTEERRLVNWESPLIGLHVIFSESSSPVFVGARFEMDSPGMMHGGMSDFTYPGRIRRWERWGSEGFGRDGLPMLL